MGKMQDGIAFAKGELKKNAEITLKEVQASAPAGLKIYPAIMTQAREDLGITATRGRKRGSTTSRKKKAAGLRASPASKKKAATKKRAQRGPEAMPSLDQVVQHIANLEEEAASLRKALGEIARIAARV